MTLFLVVALLPLALWLFAHWFEWSMADFDCIDGYWECRRNIAGPMALRVGLAILAWVLLALLVVRQRKKL